ncbi:MAG: DNA-3-methyladenine glycosylase 2 family protein [Albidovulum sp.]
MSHPQKGRAADIGRLVVSDDCVAEGAAWLAGREPRFADALAVTGPLPLRLRPGGFAALLNAIMAQQVSVASANAIWQRLLVAGLTDEAAVADADGDALRQCGLSRQKVRYAKALALARIDYDALGHQSDADVMGILTGVPGVGTWTAEIYAMFSLGRADVFAPGDLALQEAARLLFDLPQRPSARDFRMQAEDWRPWRAVAARLLWAYYRKAKDREGI